MNDFNAIIEGFLRLFVLMLPVAGVLLLWVAAYLVGGAMRVRRDVSRPGTPMDHAERAAAQPVHPCDEAHHDSHPTHAA